MILNCLTKHTIIRGPSIYCKIVYFLFYFTFLTPNLNKIRLFSTLRQPSFSLLQKSAQSCSFSDEMNKRCKFRIGLQISSRISPFPWRFSNPEHINHFHNIPPIISQDITKASGTHLPEKVSPYYAAPSQRNIATVGEIRYFLFPVNAEKKLCTKLIQTFVFATSTRSFNSNLLHAFTIFVWFFPAFSAKCLFFLVNFRSSFQFS